MSVRILFINPLGTDMYDEHTRNILSPAASQDTELVVRSLQGVPKTPYLPSAAVFHNQLFQTIIEAENEGFDGVVIGCCADPGLRDAKRLVSIPVTGPFEALAHTAPALGRLTIIAGRKNSGSWDYLSRVYGLTPYLASVREAPFDHPSPDVSMRLFKEDEAALRHMVLTEMDRAVRETGIEQSRRAVHEDGATVLFFACTLWAGLLEPVARAVPATVLDPMITPLKYIEHLATVRKHYSAQQQDHERTEPAGIPVPQKAVAAVHQCTQRQI